MAKKQDDDISIDFSWLTNLFKSDTKKRKKHIGKKENEDDISVDFTQFSTFLSKYGMFLLVLIPLIIGVSLRMESATLPITEEWATGTVHNYYKNMIGQQVQQQYPTLPSANRNALVEKQFQEYLTTNKAEVDAQVKQSADYFRSRLQDENGLTYLLAIDPYFWMGKTENLIEKGYIGDTKKDGIRWDTKMFAPIGRKDIKGGGEFHVYLQSYIYKIMKVFNPETYPRQAAFYTPVIIMAIAIICAFFIGRQISGNIGGLITGMIVAIHPSILGRTAAGFSDTDAYNIFFPLLIVWVLYSSFTAKNIKLRYAFATTAGIIGGIFSYAWVGWWFIIDFCLMALGLYLMYILFLKKDLLLYPDKLFKDTLIRNAVIITIIFTITTVFMASVINGSLNTGLEPFKAPLGFTSIKDVGTKSVWPNVYTTVAEQNEILRKDIINNVGMMLFVLTGIGLVLIIMNIYFNKDKNKDYSQLKYFFLILIWIAATFYASTKGVRWILLMIPGIAMGVGAFAGYAYTMLHKIFTKEYNLNKAIASATILGILIIPILLFPSNLISAAQNTAKNEIPSMNDAWWNTLTKIKEQSNPDAIINSWWDFGHWFKYVGDRAVTFDGASQNTPIAHWIGLTLLTDDEDLSRGLLRMLDCGSNNAFETLNKQIDKDYKSIDILYEIVKLDKINAKNTLERYGIQDTEEILQWTHCNPPENYLIASGDMIGKSGVWAHFGSWDFKRATMFNKVRQIKNLQQGIEYIQDEFGYNKEDAEALYYEIKALGVGRDAEDWISPWPSYASSRTSCSVTNHSIIQCGNGAEVNLQKMEAYFMTQQGKVKAASFTYVDSEGFHVIEQTGDNIQPYSIILIPTESGYDTILSSPEIAKSLFTKLYFFEGHGLTYFKEFSRERSINGDEIIVYNVSWDGADMNTMSAWKKKVQNSQEIRASHILVNSSEEAEEILTMINIGKISFSEAAQNYSIGPTSVKGGDLGFFKKGTMVPEFETVVFNLEIGKISEPVQTQFGYHIITVTDKRNLLSESTLLKI
jgi:dolichyl-phosphooligosaccharide-protein glycotransferase